MGMSRFTKGFAAVIAAVVEITIITLAGCVRPFGEITKSARSLVGKNSSHSDARQERQAAQARVILTFGYVYFVVIDTPLEQMVPYIRRLPEGSLMSKTSDRRASMSAEDFSNKLAKILDQSLEILPGEEQEKRLAAFEKRASRACHGTRTTASSRPRTEGIPLAARSRE